MSEKSTSVIYSELKSGYYGSKKNVFDSEHFFFRCYRPLSFFPSAVLIKCGVSANIVTGFGALCLLLAFANLALGQMLFGAVLYLFAYVVDFMDGNIARYAGRQTYFGKMIDGLVDSLTFLLFISLGLGNVAAGLSLLSPMIDVVLGVTTGFVFLMRSYFYLRISFVLAPVRNSDAQAASNGALPRQGRSPLLQLGKRLYFGLISGMPLFLLLAVLLNTVSIYLIGYFLLFSLALLFEAAYGLRRVWLAGGPSSTS